MKPSALANTPVPLTTVSTSLMMPRFGSVPAGANTAWSDVVNPPGRAGSVEINVCTNV